MMSWVDLLVYAVERVWLTLKADWYYLVLSIGISAWARLNLDKEKVAGFCRRNRTSSVLASVGVAVSTPLCSCGTTAVILGMMTSSMSWAPIVAFMVSSPLTSPGELLYSASLFGWPFALAFFISSIVLGLAGGALAYFAESRGWLKGQSRLAPPASVAPEPNGATPRARPGWRDLAREAGRGARSLLPRFTVFVFVSYLLNGLIPRSWLSSLFGQGRVYGVPLAATLGLPLYLNTESSMPLLAGLMRSGMSPGATMAFLITGAGTSVGAIAGAFTIARWRVVALVVGTLWIGGILVGYGCNALPALLRSLGL